MLKKLRLKDFRSYESVEVTFGEGINLIHGKNGQGKTNLLEAIHFLSTGRSFRHAKLQDLIRHGAKSFHIEAEFIRDSISQSLHISYDGAARQVRYNETKSATFASLLGILPSVVYAPSDGELISGAPLLRRRFLNVQMAQSDPSYVYHLSRYSRALKQRNALLKNQSENGIEIWEEQMARSAEVLIEKRTEWNAELVKRAKKHLREITGSEKLALRYQNSFSGNPEEVYRINRPKEMVLGATLFGPHRDDIFIAFGGKSARNFCSEGQKRAIIASLKLAEWEALTERMGSDQALFAIDDWTVHLDSEKNDNILDKLKGLDQVFLTSVETIDNVRLFEVSQL